MLREGAGSQKRARPSTSRVLRLYPCNGAAATSEMEHSKKERL